MVQLRARPILTAYSTAFLFMTGKVPGNPKQTGQTWVLASLPNIARQPQKCLVAVLRSQWTSSPMTGSYSIKTFQKTSNTKSLRHQEIFYFSFFEPLWLRVGFWFNPLSKSAFACANRLPAHKHKLSKTILSHQRLYRTIETQWINRSGKGRKARKTPASR